jgi:hypothetical protein
VTKGKITVVSVAAWIATILSVYTGLVILNAWFLVPNDPALTPSQNLKTKLEIIAVSAAIFVGLIALARWSFKKSRDHNLG